MDDAPNIRRSLVPKSAIAAVAIVLAVVLAAGGAVLWVYHSRLVTTPDLIGSARVAADAALGASGLRGALDGTLVSADVPAGRVLSQSPAAGTAVERGSVVAYVISAGRQTVRVPDIVGVEIGEATRQIEALGLMVSQREESSEETRPIVLEAYPAPGSMVNSGDTVRLIVPGSAADVDVLLPYDLSGLAVLVDPSAVSGSAGDDVTLEVGRRLVSLLQASGATVSLTRSSGQEVSGTSERTARARESTAAVLIGLDARASAASGIIVTFAGDSTASELARAITAGMRMPGAELNAPVAGDDPVCDAFGGPAVRVNLGNASDAADRTRFADPGWADEAARGIYRGVGTAYAR